MPRLLPPIDKRFPVNRPYAPNAGHKGPYLTTLLKRLIEKKINYIDPETQLRVKGRVKDAVLWRLIANATEGEITAIKEILDRIDGKQTDKVVENNIQVFSGIKTEGKPVGELISDFTNRISERVKG